MQPKEVNQRVKNKMEKTIENKFLEPDYTKNWKHRVHGAIGITLAGIFGYAGLKEPVSVPLIAGASFFAIEGGVDVITGCHHYCSQKIVGGIKYIINKIKK